MISDETPHQLEERSDIPKMEKPDFECTIPETALQKLSPEIAEIMKMQNVTMQYSKWQCEALTRIGDNLRKMDGRVICLEKQKATEDGDHEKIGMLYKKYEMVYNWKILLFIIAGLGGGVFSIVTNILPYVH